MRAAVFMTGTTLTQKCDCSREAMQGLLRKLGAGFGDMMPSMTSSTQFKVCVRYSHNRLSQQLCRS